MIPHLNRGSWRTLLRAGGLLLAVALPDVVVANPTAELLVDLIRLDTSNPPGRTQSVADLLAPQFAALGFEVDIIATPDSAKVHFIARLRGDGSKRPVLLAAHADVVGVERQLWTVDPSTASSRRATSTAAVPST